MVKFIFNKAANLQAVFFHILSMIIIIHYI